MTQRMMTDKERDFRGALCAYVAVRPILRSRSDEGAICGLCGSDLSRFDLHIASRDVVVYACSDCGWHTRRIDGRFATVRDLYDLRDDVEQPDRGTEAVSWYPPPTARR